jgi:hypothetical protein
MKKRWTIILIAISALVITLCSCTTAHRAARRTHVAPAPVVTPRHDRAPAHRNAPRTHVAPGTDNRDRNNTTHRRDTTDGVHGGNYRAERDGNVDNRSTHDGMNRTTRDGFSRNNVPSNPSIAPRHNTSPPVRSLPRVNRIPATRIPVR